MSINKVLEQLLAETQPFLYKKKNKGEVQFIKSSIADDYIQKIIAYIAKATNRSHSDIEQEILMREMQSQQQFAKAPILYETMAHNEIENIVFSMLTKATNSEPIPGAPKFNVRDFNLLKDVIRRDHDLFKKMVGFVKQKMLRKPFVDVIKVDPNTKQVIKGGGDNPNRWASIKTAAATANGEFMFNEDFMQDLLNFAYLKGIKPKGKKYSNNGGLTMTFNGKPVRVSFPPEYAYIEFVIIHEFFHYVYDDFYYQNMIPDADPTIINYVGDFRSNYFLVKSGYEQLPIGLFNDNINQDRFTTYKEMYDVVKNELDKLDDKDKDNTKNDLDNRSQDDHNEGQNQGKQSGAGKENTSKDIDKHGEKVEQSMNSADKTGDAESSKEDEQGTKGNQGSKSGRRGAGHDETKGISDLNRPPTINWKELLKRMIASKKPQQITHSYAKQNPRGLTQQHIGAQLGSSVIKPGAIKQETPVVKLLFVIDSSGSMDHVVGLIYSNLNNLFSTLPNMKKVDFLLMKFSNTHDTWICNFKSDKAVKLVDKGNVQAVKNADSVQTIFQQTIGSLTNVNSSMIEEILGYMKDKYSVMIFSDSDVCDGANLKQVKRIFKAYPKQAFMICDSINTLALLRSRIGSVGANISCIE